MSSENQNAPKTNPALAQIFRGLGINLIFRGVLEIAVGILLLVAPAPTIKILTIVIGAALILSGLLQLLTAARAKDSKKHWALINAIVLLVLGVLVVCFPLRADKIWIIVLGMWLVVTALNEFFGGGWRRFWGILSCVLSLLIGACFIAFPFIGLECLVLITGGVLITSGVLAICAGADMRIASKKL